MHARRHLLAALTASAALLLGACTSDADPAQPSSPGMQQDPPTSTDPGPDPEAAGATAAPGAGGVLCRYVTASTQRTVAGADLTDPHQLMVENDPESWVCEVRDGDQALMRVSILRGEDAWDSQRGLAQEAEGVIDGPEWLGEAYSSPQRITGLTMCATSEEPDVTYEEYALVVESVTDPQEDLTAPLRVTASTMARNLDQAVQCSPKMARGEIARS